MKKIFSKLIILIGFVFLSMGMFAQIATKIYYDNYPSIPSYNPEQSCDIKAHAVVIWHLNSGNKLEGNMTIFTNDDQNIVPINFVGTSQQLQQVAHTEVRITFNDGVCGTSNIFPGFAYIVLCPNDFPAATWWYRNPGDINY